MSRKLRSPKPKLELMRSETFPFAERFAADVSPLGVLAYFDSGPPPASSGPALPPLVFLHALGMNYTEWEYVARELGQHTRVIGLDLPGCGHSVRPKKPYRLAEMTDAVSALIDHLGIDKPVIVGHSFGGRIALEVPLARPERLAGLVLMNSAGLVRYPSVFQLLGKKLLRPTVIGTAMLGLAPIFMHRIFASTTPRTERFIEQVVGRFDARFSYDFAQHACAVVPDLISDVIDRLPELRLPVQAIWGGRDELLAFTTIEPALRTLPDVTIDLLPNCGHMPNLEQPEQTCSIILSFLARLSPREGDSSAAGQLQSRARMPRDKSKATKKGAPMQAVKTPTGNTAGRNIN